MTLIGVIALILRFSLNLIALLADYVHKLLSPSSSLPLLAKNNALYSAVSLR